MKRGMYADYHGKEYKAHAMGNDEYYLYSLDPGEVENGFYYNNAGKYIKLIKKDELEDVYSIHTVAKYCGQEVEIVDEKKIDM